MVKISLKKVRFLVLFIFLIKEALDGLFRYYANGIGMPFLVYAPVGFMFLYLVFFLLSNFSVQVNKYIFVEFLVVVVWLFIGLINNGLTQSLFAVYILIPFFFGQVSYNVLFIESFKLSRVVFILILVSFLGVILDVLYKMPWEGFYYQIGGLELEGSRQWSAFGLFRFAGFTRSSYALASFILFGLLFLYGKINNFLYFILWIFGGVAIAITTTKGILLVYLLLSLIILLKSISKDLFIFSSKSVIWISSVIMVFLPLSTLFFSFSLNTNNLIQKFIFSSFEIRLVEAWPEAFSLLDKASSYLVGEGFGTVGTASLLYSASNYNPGDNLFVYLFLIFGITSILGLIILFFKIPMGYLIQREELALFGLIFILIYGIFSNILENPILSFFLGVLVAKISNINILLPKVLDDKR